MKKLEAKATIWLDFINFILLPFLILISILSCFRGLKLWELVLAIIFVIYYIVTFIMLSKRQKLAYYLLYGFLFLSYYTIYREFIVKYNLHYIFVIILGIIWLILNIIYIWKRKDMFYKHNIKHIKKCPGCNRIIPVDMPCCGRCNYKE